MYGLLKFSNKYICSNEYSFIITIIIIIIIHSYGFPHSPPLLLLILPGSVHVKCFSGPFHLDSSPPRSLPSLSPTPSSFTRTGYSNSNRNVLFTHFFKNYFDIDLSSRLKRSSTISTPFELPNWLYPSSS